MRSMAKYIYQKKEWPHFKWDNGKIIDLLGEVRNLQGRIMGRMESLGFALKREAFLDTVTLEVLKSSEIELRLAATARQASDQGQVRRDE